MKRLFVLYDSDCPLCLRVRVWLERQPAFVRLAYLPLQSSEVRRRFPGIKGFHPEQQLIVVSDLGEMWRGESAWITVLWALREYRAWAIRLAHPTLRPFARQACVLISENRYNLSKWLRSAGHRDLRECLAAQPVESCASGHSASKVLCRKH